MKRKKVDDNEEQKESPENSESFAGSEEASDSFDDDFGQDEEGEDELPPVDDEFDVEAYLKWRKEHPDEE